MCGAGEQRPIAAPIVDMDGLLVDSEPASELAMRRFLQSHGHALLPETVSGSVGRRLPEAIAIIAEAYALTSPLDELIDAFDALRLESLPGAVVPMPGAVAVLDWASQYRLPTALATRQLEPAVDVDARLDSLSQAVEWLEARGAGRMEPSPTAGTAATMADDSTDATRTMGA